MKKLLVIKIGGNVIDDPLKLEKFLSDLSQIKGAKVLVHGGGKAATSLAAKLGIEQQLVNGRRITDAATLDVCTMVFAGLVNKRIVAKLQANGTNALGLSGADLNSIFAEKRSHTTIDYGYVGDIDVDGMNTQLISGLIDSGITPVFCSITHDGKGQLLNTNADTIASALAIALSKAYEVQLNYCFEKKGVLSNLKDDNSVINKMTKPEYENMIRAGLVSDGMMPKLDNAFSAIEKGVASVIIGHADELLKMVNEYEHAGTALTI